MSYVNMDHAAWVQKEMEASKRRKPTKKDRDRAAEHKGWFASPEKLNDFQRRAFDILGIIGNGIYNCPISWDTVVWHPRFVIVAWRNSLATWDFSELSRLVFFCHEARIRASIAPNGPRHMELALHERVAMGGMAVRHPNLDEAVAAFRAELRPDHPIIYREPTTAIAAE